MVILNKTYNQNHYIKELLDASYQEVKILVVLAYRNSGDKIVTTDFPRRYFLPRIKTENYDIETDGRNFIISQLIT